MTTIQTKTELCVWAEYGWIDGDDKIRSKGYFLFIEKEQLLNPKFYPEMNFDGSSTNQAIQTKSEIILKPIKLLRDPMKERRDASSPVTILVWCSCWNPDGTPHHLNTREQLASWLLEHKEWEVAEEPMFGLEQEYFITCRGEPIKSMIPEATSQGPYYCGYGSHQRIGRKIAEEHARRCANIGILLWGMNAEVAPGQWEFQTRPNMSLETGDELWIARWILSRTAEDLELDIHYHPKLFGEQWNGSGCHLNVSTKTTRDVEEGYLQVIERIQTYHEQNPAWDSYGKENHLRLTGTHETSSMNSFTSGVGDRTASIRIPNSTFQKKKGYLEDRRPAANIDPYLAILWMLKAIH